MNGRDLDGIDLQSLISFLSKDIFSADLLSNLQNNNISTEHVGTVPQSTGVAQITYMEVIIELFIIPERII